MISCPPVIRRLKQGNGEGKDIDKAITVKYFSNNYGVDDNDDIDNNEMNDIDNDTNITIMA